MSYALYNLRILPQNIQQVPQVKFRSKIMDTSGKKVFHFKSKIIKDELHDEYATSCANDSQLSYIQLVYMETHLGDNTKLLLNFLPGYKFVSYMVDLLEDATWFSANRKSLKNVELSNNFIIQFFFFFLFLPFTCLMIDSLNLYYKFNKLNLSLFAKYNV